MAKILVFNEAARRGLKEGVDIVANAVKTTLGPKGRSVTPSSMPSYCIHFQGCVRDATKNGEGESIPGILYFCPGKEGTLVPAAGSALDLHWACVHRCTQPYCEQRGSERRDLCTGSLGCWVF